MSIHHKKGAHSVLYEMACRTWRPREQNKNKKLYLPKLLYVGYVYTRNFWRFSFKSRPFRIYYSHDIFDGFGILVVLKT